MMNFKYPEPKNVILFTKIIFKVVIKVRFFRRVNLDTEIHYRVVETWRKLTEGEATLEIFLTPSALSFRLQNLSTIP